MTFVLKLPASVFLEGGLQFHCKQSKYVLNKKSILVTGVIYGSKYDSKKHTETIHKAYFYVWMCLHMCIHVHSVQKRHRQDTLVSRSRLHDLARLGFTWQLTKSVSHPCYSCSLPTHMFRLFTFPAQVDVFFSSVESAASWEVGWCWRRIYSTQIFQEEGFPCLLLL
jgi:hypothetical protein|uniref:Uncharacterized protein n=1 Tax=Mus musculus TaxID=10090 RepID=Q3TNU6_MOUSE|nr:unnamed protein product [Mus musculus]